MSDIVLNPLSESFYNIRRYRYYCCLHSLFRWGNWGFKGWNDFPKVPQLENGGVGRSSEIIWSQSLSWVITLQGGLLSLPDCELFRRWNKSYSPFISIHPQCPAQSMVIKMKNFKSPLCGWCPNMYLEVQDRRCLYLNASMILEGIGSTCLHIKLSPLLRHTVSLKTHSTWEWRALLRLHRVRNILPVLLSRQWSWDKNSGSLILYFIISPPLYL